MHASTAGPSTPLKYRGTLHAFQTIVKEEGVTALFKGLTPQLFGLGHVAVQFPMYEYLKKKIAVKGSSPSILDKISNQLTLLLCIVYTI